MHRIHSLIFVQFSDPGRSSFCC
uniref:Uncharacterized protein n=1 Tax=Arundo donax TaxID=35708 RepID=A0A0A8Y9Y7_ARUDO